MWREHEIGSSSSSSIGSGTRSTIEQCIEESRGEVGLGQYEVRHWHSWYRHITLALMAHTWLAAHREQNATGGTDGAGGRRLPEVELPLFERSARKLLVRSSWRRKCYRARGKAVPLPPSEVAQIYWPPAHWILLNYGSSATDLVQRN
jgi:hypothetical protein